MLIKYPKASLFVYIFHIFKNKKACCINEFEFI